MKKFFLTIIFLLSYCSLAYAQPTFTYQVNGITGDLLANAQAQLASLAPADESHVLTYADISQQYGAAPAAIIKSLQPFGYFNVKVQTQLVNQGNDAWQAIYTVTVGEPIRIKQVVVTFTGAGQDNVELQKLRNNFPLQAGQILTMPAYNHVKQVLFNTAEMQGYITAQLAVHEVHINLKDYTATVILQLATGPRFYFGKVYFSKNPFAERFLRRYMTFQEGEPYSSQKLLAFQDNLINSNYFRQVSVQSQREQAENYYIPSQVVLVPRKPQQYTFGLGYGTDTGVRGTLGWDLRRVTDTGQRFSTLLRLSQVQNSLQAIYSIPGKNPVSDQYNLTASLLSYSINQGQSFTEQIGAADITSQGNWKRTISLNNQYERFQFTGQPTQHSNLLFPGVTWTYLKADNVIYPKQGQQFSIILQGTRQELISSTSFAQAEVKDKYVFSPTDASRVLIRGDVGYTTVHDLNSFPLSLRFYAGGTQSIRGYPYQSLGPGRYLAVGSVEYQHRIIGNWNAATFYDAGNATNHTTARLMEGVGLGVVWKSPVGPMELVVAQAINKPGRPNQIQFNMGPDFG